MKMLLGLLLLCTSSFAMASQECTYSLTNENGEVTSTVTDFGSNACRNAQDSCLNSLSERSASMGIDHLDCINEEALVGDEMSNHPGRRPPVPPPYNPPHFPPRYETCRVERVTQFGQIVSVYRETARTKHEACGMAQMYCQTDLRRGNNPGQRCITRY